MKLNTDKREDLYNKYGKFIEVDTKLDRALVSFQANKKEIFYRWFKYKEGFSKRLVKYFLNKYHPNPGNILDPFAGVGSTLFAARELGWDVTGIEILPVGIYAFISRLASESINIEDFSYEISKFKSEFKLNNNINGKIKHISITEGAFSEETELYIENFLIYCDTISDEKIKQIFKFSAFSILEEISYTRKDGQYLRWDYRANKSWGKTKFNKGRILPFYEAITKKLEQICQDLKYGNGNDLFSIVNENNISLKYPKLLQGSSLELMPQLESDHFDLIMTSPPYCNRYDYTRTYALELIFLGYDDEQVKNLRQEMLSCTVENREKFEILKGIYEKSNKIIDFEKIIKMYKSHEAMFEVNSVLDSLNAKKLLNNLNIPRMVKNYFLEMAFIIFEMYRVLKNNGFVIMVNDNVRYGGQEIPVDLILSDFAVDFGFILEKIWTLPVGKGNSSQQMGSHGRTELRKCVYVWRKSN
ncbi:hypothetical protein AMJ80_03740 [bacterium SM23_31]|nr:MAG: hypothetical protein AMJ80_03740 [bacterium SM23_31]